MGDIGDLGIRITLGHGSQEELGHKRILPGQGVVSRGRRSRRRRRRGGGLALGSPAAAALFLLSLLKWSNRGTPSARNIPITIPISVSVFSSSNGGFILGDGGGPDCPFHQQQQGIPLNWNRHTPISTFHQNLLNSWPTLHVIKNETRNQKMKPPP